MNLIKKARQALMVEQDFLRPKPVATKAWAIFRAACATINYSRPEFAFTERIHGRPHVMVMRRDPAFSLDTARAFSYPATNT
jgi:hypothetical protein